MPRGQEHNPTYNDRIRVRDLTRAGVSMSNTASIIGISVETLKKYYASELRHALDWCVEDVGNKAINMAMEGNEKMISLVLKTRGAKHGWVEKQIVENVSSEQTQELMEKISKLEKDAERDY